MQPFQSKQVSSFQGDVKVPGDKSISHRCVILGSLAIGQTHISGLLEGEDVIATLNAFAKMGVGIHKKSAGEWVITGAGIGGLREADTVLDMGNSGTAARLLLGVLSGHDMTSFLSGDASLRKRPMQRVTQPLSEMGAEFVTRSEGRLPLVVRGRTDLLPITYSLPVASAQVKSAILLAGLCTAGETGVIEKTPTRDHTERLLGFFGGTILREDLSDGATKITVTGQPELQATSINVPGDPSSAAFLLGAAAMIPQSDVIIRAVGMNATRIGFLTTLQEMGADITPLNAKFEAGEPIADLHIRYAPLQGIDVPASRVATMIDEYPILAVVAATATGPTRMSGIGELRVKESDRLAAMAQGLLANGIKVDVGADWMVVHGGDAPISGGAKVKTWLDHRIAMSFLVLGMVAKYPIIIDDLAPIETSFPQFGELMNGLGANFSAA